MNAELSVESSRATELAVSTIRDMFIRQGDNKEIPLLQWQYLEPPGGSFVSIAYSNLDSDKKPASLYAVMPVRFFMDEKEIWAAQSFDTLTLEPFRGQGLFTSLATSLYSSIAKDGFAVVYGIPNGSSVAGFSKYLNWSFIDPLPLIIRPIGTRYLRVLTKIRKPRLNNARLPIKRSEVQEVDICPSDIGELFECLTKKSYVGVVRDHKYLSWRLERPGSTYRLFTWRSAEGTLRGFGVYELVYKHGCALGYVMELMVNPKFPQAGTEVLQHMVNEMKKRGADLIFGWSLPKSNSRPSFKRSFFMAFPTRLRPIELHLGYRLLQDNDSENISFRENWNISYLDSDTV